MVAKVIDGKGIAKAKRAALATKATELSKRLGRPPGLDVVLVGEDAASMVYTRSKERAAAKANIRGRLHRLPADTSQAQLLAEVERLNADDTVDGILVQLPLPAHLDENAITEAIDPAKDVDGFHAFNAGQLWTGGAALVPCTPTGCLELIAHALHGPGFDGSQLRLDGKHAVVIGRSNIVGKPMAALLLGANATVTICHSRTQDLAGMCRQADIIVAAVGRPRMVTGDFLKPGAIVIDVGINRTPEGKLCGDVDEVSAGQVAGHLSPVPGGVGPMTIACLLSNTLKAAARRADANGSS